MTTIAANRECIAGDSQVTYVNNWSAQKVYRIGTSLFGMAGDVGADVFLEWAGEYDFKPKFKPNFLPIWDEIDFDVIEVAEDGIALWDKHLVRMRLKDDNYAVGSGSRIAILLMRKFGLTPEQAVVECCEFDPYTKGPVDVLYLKEPKVIITNSEKEIVVNGNKKRSERSSSK